MQVHTDLNNLPEFKNAVLTIGTFDGVHRGHKKIIEQLKTTAHEVNGETVIITFHPHPRKIIHDKQGDVKLLTTLDEKIVLLKNLGINHLVIIDFNEAFAAQTAEEYVVDFLYKKFIPHTIIIGYDHKYGAGRKGDYQLLEQYGKQLGFNVNEINAQTLNEVTISSTSIRKALLTADISTANKFLDYRYFIKGKVKQGDRIGRTIGYPTANIDMHNTDKLIPQEGIYAASTIYDGITYNGMLYIGYRPVINGKELAVEIYIFDFDKDIYTQELTLEFHKYIRADKNLKSIEELKLQLQEDEKNIRNYFEELYS